MRADILLKVNDKLEGVNIMSSFTTGRISNDRKLAIKQGALYAVALCFSVVIGSAAAVFSTANAQTAEQVSLSSEVFIERTEIGEDGSEKTVLKTPKDVVVIPGDRLKFILSYKNETGDDVTGFKATNPIPGAVVFTDAREDWAQVSVDGGKTWGKLEELVVEAVDESNGTTVSRAASNADVTHVRWVFDQKIANAAKGDISYRAIVR